MKPISYIRSQFEALPELHRIIASELAISWPCPWRRNQAIIISAFYYGRHYNPALDEAVLYVPSWRADFDADTASLVGVAEYPAEQFGFSGSRFTALGLLSYDDEDAKARSQGLGSAVEREAALDQLYDELVPAWSSGKRIGQESTQAFSAMFMVEASQLLFPAYRAISREFFDWIGVR